MKKQWVVISSIVAAMVVVSCTALAESETKSQEEITAESVAKCAATASTPATPQQIIEKVNEACELIAKEGEGAFPKFGGKDSDFLFGGTYIWVHTPKDTTIVVHHIKPVLIGKSLAQLRDRNGKAFFAEMNVLVKNKGAGWVDYVWPKPGEGDVSPKCSYVKLAKHGETEYVVGCGVYDLTVADVEKKLAE